MKIVTTKLPGVVIVEPDVQRDPRGFFVESFSVRTYAESGLHALGVDGERILQFNHSHSVRDTVRGLHFQEPQAQGKLVWVMSGRAFDVAVDVRRGAPTFGSWAGVELSGENHKLMWIPKGFAHGYAVWSDAADVIYACTDLYAPASQHAIHWNDPAIGIDWGVREPLLSERDTRAPRLSDAPVLPVYRPAPENP